MFLTQEPRQPSLWRTGSSQKTNAEHWLYRVRVEVEKQNNMGKRKRNPLALCDSG